MDNRSEVREFLASRRGAARRRHPGRGEGDSVPVGSVRGHGEGVRLHPRQQRGTDRARNRTTTSGTVDDDDRHARGRDGLAVQKEIVGATAVDGMYAAATDDTVHFQHYLSANCFGDHYTRTGIDVKTRELLTFSMLVSMGGCDPQVKGHVSANLNVGNDRDVLLAVVNHLLPFIGYPRSLNALSAVNEISPAPKVRLV